MGNILEYFLFWVFAFHTSEILNGNILPVDYFNLKFLLRGING